MKTIHFIKDHSILLIIVLVAGIFLGWLFFHGSGGERLQEGAAIEQEPHDHDHKIIYTCSMHPQIKQDHPGECPICGMDLVPLSSVSGAMSHDNPDEIRMSESAVKLAEISTTRVRRGSADRIIYLQGKVKEDEGRISALTARFDGRIEKLFVNFTGETVEKGDTLANIYSPELVTAQRELLEAISLKDSRPSLYHAARVKLKLWDLTDAQINAIENEGTPILYFTVLSPVSGTVMERYVSAGDYVSTGDPLFRVTDLSRVWVMFDAYEADLPWIKKGDKIEFTLQADPGRSYVSRVAYIDPFIDPGTRSARIRVELNNTGLILKPGMFAGGKLYAGMAGGSDQLIIPASSVLWTGKRSIVYVKVPDRKTPTFQFREIVTGPRAGDFYMVIQGLKEGEDIATNGVFRIDAAAQLEGKRSMMNPGDQAASETSGDLAETSTLHAAQPLETGNIAIPEKFRVQLTAVYEKYLALKNALVASDPEETRHKAGEVDTALEKVDMELLTGEVHGQWMNSLGVLKVSLEGISGSGDLAAQRKSFSSFNTAFYEAIKTFGLHDVQAYYQYCPMANQDQGAYWFSETENIKNPYFGDEMLQCGENVEVIK